MAKHPVKPVRQAQIKMDGKSISPQKELAELLKTQFPKILAEYKLFHSSLRAGLYGIRII